MILVTFTSSVYTDVGCGSAGGKEGGEEGWGGEEGRIERERGWKNGAT